MWKQTLMDGKPGTVDFAKLLCCRAWLKSWEAPGDRHSHTNTTTDRAKLCSLDNAYLPHTFSAQRLLCNVVEHDECESEHWWMASLGQLTLPSYWVLHTFSIVDPLGIIWSEVAKKKTYQSHYSNLGCFFSSKRAEMKTWHLVQESKSLNFWYFSIRSLHVWRLSLCTFEVLMLSFSVHFQFKKKLSWSTNMPQSKPKEPNRNRLTWKEEAIGKYHLRAAIEPKLISVPHFLSQQQNQQMIELVLTRSIVTVPYPDTSTLQYADTSGEMTQN